MKKILIKTAKYVGSMIPIVAGVHCTFEYLFDFVICKGPSMEPTLYSNNILITDKISSRLGRISRGDIVIAKNPNKPKQLICKRVLGTPGDIILTQNVLAAAFPPGLENEEEIQYKKVVIPPGQVWLEGDNSSNSTDSRFYGPIPKGLLVSRVLFRLLPIESFGFV